MKVIDVSELRDVIKDGASLATAGFSKSRMPEYIYKGIEDSFLEYGHPRDLIYNANARSTTDSVLRGWSLTFAGPIYSWRCASVTG